MRVFALERSPVSNHRVLIVSDQPLFAQGIRTLVETRTRAEVIGTESYGVNILDCATRLQPDIIILVEDQNVPSLLPLALLDTSPNVRVVRLSLDGNIMHVYDGHRLAANSAEDLVSSVDTFTKTSLITA